MPSLSDAIATTNRLEGYAPVAHPSGPPSPAPSSGMEPGRNAMLRCPMPVLWQSTPDTLRQFYVGGQVPQVRMMMPATPAPISTGSSSTVVESISSITGGGSSTVENGSNSTAKTAVLKSAVLPPGTAFAGTVFLAKSFQLLSVSVQSPCRVQFYGTAAAQASDSSRGLDAPPAAGTAQNIICDVVLDTAPYNWSFQNRIGANADAPQSSAIYVTITNLDQSSDAETLTVQYVPLES